MKRALYLIALTFISILLVAPVGCRSDTDKQEEVEIRLAPIHEVRVTQTRDYFAGEGDKWYAESLPEQIFVYIKGGLADSCTTFHELKTERSGNTINITVTTKRPKDAICAQVYGFFERNMTLGSDFIMGESYTINVNNVTTSFEYH